MCGTVVHNASSASSSSSRELATRRSRPGPSSGNGSQRNDRTSRRPQARQQSAGWIFGSFAQLVLDKRTFLLLVEMATREIELARVLALLGVAETQADELRPMLDAQFHANLHAMMTIENLVSASYDISNTYWQLYMQTL